jgi:REP element-mobilizing transposase RayT
MTFYRRNLPHWHPEGKAIFLTWRLAGSLPQSSGGSRIGSDRTQKKHTGKSAGATEEGGDWDEKFQSLDAELDRAASGPVWLRSPEIACYVERAILHGAELGHYLLQAYVVMPNHVHALLGPRVPLRRITGAIKGVSARDANTALRRTGRPFWQNESFDRWIRDEAEFQRIRSYIELNPVAAGLVASPDRWPCSSANPASRINRS